MKITKVALFFNVLFNCFIITDYYVSQQLYRSAPNSFYIYYLLGALLTLILSFILPKKSNIIRRLRNGKFLKYLLIIYLGISFVFTTNIFSSSLSSYFFYGYPPFIFIIIILCFAYLSSRYKVRSGLNASFPMIIIAIPLILYNLLGNRQIYDFTQLRLSNFSSLKISYFPVFIFLILDSFLYILILPFSNAKTNKTIVFSTGLFFLLEAIESLIIVSIVGDSLVEYKGIGFFLYSLESLSGYIGNFDFIYIFLITLFQVVKLVFIIKIIELLLINKKDKASKPIFIALAIISILLSFVFYDIEKYYNYFIYIMIIILIPFYIGIRSEHNGRNK